MGQELAHDGVIGLTRYGKSYYCKDRFLKHRGAGIYFNPRRVAVKGTIGIDREASAKRVMEALRSGHQITYKLSGSLSVDRNDINKFVELCMREKWAKPLMMVFDEVQDYAYQGDIKSGALRVARTGLGENIIGIFNAQRPADVSKIVISQCERKIFFCPAPEDYKWIEQKGYPLEQIIKAINGRKYYYCEYFLGQLSPAKKINFRGEL
jgi:DNA helicase HerA-like ATPase